MTLSLLRSRVEGFVMVFAIEACKIDFVIPFWKGKTPTFDDPTGIKLWIRMKSAWRNFYSLFIARQADNHYHHVEKLKV